MISPERINPKWLGRRAASSKHGGCRRRYPFRDRAVVRQPQVWLAAIAHEKEAGTGELVTDGLDRDDLVAAAAFAIMPALDRRTEAYCVIRGLQPRPREVAIARLAVAMAFGLAIGDALALDNAAVRGIVARVDAAP